MANPRKKSALLQDAFDDRAPRDDDDGAPSPDNELERLRADLALAREREAQLEAERQAAKQEADLQHRLRLEAEHALKVRAEETAAAEAARFDAESRAVVAEDRARTAESQLVGVKAALPAVGPFRLRLGLLGPRDETSRRTLTVNYGGAVYTLSQENRRGQRFNPRHEVVLETNDRMLAEHILRRRFVEVAPEPTPVLARQGS